MSSACKQNINSENYKQPRKIAVGLPIMPGERWLTMVGVDGKLVTQKVPDDAVIIRRQDLPVGWG